MKRKYKYVMINGWAFFENKDMAKLSKLAKKGWILESVTSIFYKLRKDDPQDLDYTMDYQPDFEQDYYEIFKKAGWNPVTTVGGHMHIFSAPKGTVPIYTDRQDQAKQYAPMIKCTARNSMLGFPIVVLTLFCASFAEGALKHVIFIAFIVAWAFFIFNFMPYLGYLFRSIRLKRRLD